MDVELDELLLEPELDSLLPIGESVIPVHTHVKENPEFYTQSFFKEVRRKLEKSLKKYISSHTNTYFDENSRNKPNYFELGKNFFRAGEDTIILPNTNTRHMNSIRFHLVPHESISLMFFTVPNDFARAGYMSLEIDAEDKIDARELTGTWKKTKLDNYRRYLRDNYVNVWETNLGKPNGYHNMAALHYARCFAIIWNDIGLQRLCETYRRLPSLEYGPTDEQKELMALEPNP
ncbi:MAG: hypothetical protein ACOCXG_03120 [Nanoarchaeota archaeon]